MSREEREGERERRHLVNNWLLVIIFFYFQQVFGDNTQVAVLSEEAQSSSQL